MKDAMDSLEGTSHLKDAIGTETRLLLPGHSSHLEAQWQSAEQRATHHARGQVSSMRFRREWV